MHFLQVRHDRRRATDAWRLEFDREGFVPIDIAGFANDFRQLGVTPTSSARSAASFWAGSTTAPVVQPAQNSGEPG